MLESYRLESSQACKETEEQDEDNDGPVRRFKLTADNAYLHKRTNV